MANRTEQAAARPGLPWRAIGWGGAVALLLLPFLAMQFTSEMNWGAGDFIFVAALLGTLGGLLELGVRMSRNWSYRAGFALALLGTLLVVWANAAVGIVGSDDNPANARFLWALGLGIVVAAVARLTPKGMTFAMLATAAGLVAAFVIAQTEPRDEPWVSTMLEAFGTSIFVLLFVAAAWLFRKAALDQSSSSS